MTEKQKFQIGDVIRTNRKYSDVPSGDMTVVGTATVGGREVVYVREVRGYAADGFALVRRRHEGEYGL